MIAFDDVGLNGLNLWKFHVDWTTPANTTFTGPTKIYDGLASPRPATARTCITQPGTTQKLDSLADRLMYRLPTATSATTSRWCVNHSVDVSGHAGVRWYELRSPERRRRGVPAGHLRARHEPPLDGLAGHGPARAT